MERCSPQIAETLLWFFGRWSLSYLLVDPDAHGPLSPTLSASFAGDTGHSQLENLLHDVSRNLLQWTGEVTVLQQLAESLATMSRSGTLAKQMVKCRGFADLVNDVVRRSEALPEAVLGYVATAR